MVKDRGPGDGTGRADFEPHWDGVKTTGAGAWEQKRRLAQAMRLVIERLVPSNAPEEELRIAVGRRAPVARRQNVGCESRGQVAARDLDRPCSAPHV